MLVPILLLAKLRNVLLAGLETFCDVKRINCTLIFDDFSFYGHTNVTGTLRVFIDNTYLF